MSIEDKFKKLCATPSDINEHLQTLFKLGQECKTIVELGVRDVVSSYAFALAKPDKLWCVDKVKTPNVDIFIDECKKEDINVKFLNFSSLDLSFDRVDMLFIDTLHTYEQLSRELELHHQSINKYIVLHDVITYGYTDEIATKSSTKGLMKAVEQFLETNKCWKISKLYENNNGLLVLERKKNVAILTIATGGYKALLTDLIKSIDEYYLPDLEKDIFVFSDVNIFNSAKNKIIYNKIEHQQWPFITLNKYTIFNSQIEKLKHYDYIIFMDSDLLIHSEVNSLPDTPLFGVIHPANKLTDGVFWWTEKNTNSTAYLPYKTDKPYLQGCMWGGRGGNTCTLITTLHHNTQIDLKNNIIAVWHDESHLNKYFSIIPTCCLTVLNQNYNFPGNWQIHKDVKIIHRHKPDVGSLRKVETSVSKQSSQKKYKLSLGCIFKNESMNMSEWITHYFNRGVDHIYMIDDGSTDNYLDIIMPYVDAGTITLFKNDIPKIKNRQVLAYNKFLLPRLHQSEWFMINDMDEFVYSPNTLKLCDVLDKYSDYGTIYNNWFNFNSNNNIEHPKSIVDSCILRMKEDQVVFAKLPDCSWKNIKATSVKFIINTKFFDCKKGFSDVHVVDSNVKSIRLSNKENNYDMIINHYMTQSKEFWEKVKMQRGDVNNYFPDDARNWHYFSTYDIGDVVDTRLRDQNKEYGLS